MDLQQFRERVAAALEHEHPGADIDQFGDDGIALTLPDGRGPLTWNLARFHAVYSETPRDLDRLVAQVVSFASRVERPAAPSDVRMLVRPRSFLTTGPSGGVQQLARHLAGDLFAIVAVDEGDAVAFPAAEDLRRDLGLDDESVWSLALQNSPGASSVLYVPAPGEVQVFIGEEGEATSCLAHEQVWRRLEEQASDGFVVVPLEKNVLVVAGSLEPETAGALRNLIAVAEASPDFLSSAPLTRKDGQWVEALRLDPAFDPRRLKH